MNSGKNTAASVRQRLLNLARDQSLEFQLILTRYALERFLYRLTQSEYENDFILKGAMLFQVWSGNAHRPTRDLDLLSFGKPDLTHYATVLKKICEQSVLEDGLIFKTDTIELARIKEDDEYQGLRAQILVMLDTARIPLQIDIGFGDSIVPEPGRIEYPTLLDLPAPRLRAYSRETVIAEKFHAMIHLGIANSRMKDFYDIWFLASKYEFEGEVLSQAIAATFKRRDTPLPAETPLAFTMEFYEDSTKATQWNAFLRKGKLSTEPMDLKEITLLLKKLIMPLVQSSIKNENFEGVWSPNKADWTPEG